LESVSQRSRDTIFGVRYFPFWDPDNADKVLGALSPHESDPPSMPSDGPYWTADQFALFTEWQIDGYEP
jgi:hypothetical protein